MKNENVEIIKNLTPDIVAFGDSNRLKQVFINILQNAREVMPDGGTMYITTSILQNNSVQIQFRDTGCGISKEQLGKIFCPTYTTKADCNGSGLGLSVCKTIIEEFGGTIDLDSKIGEGTIVSIVLAKCSIDQDKDHENVA
jgi:signal transduction histidine kinase